MNYIPLFLPDFKRLVKVQKFGIGEETSLHLVTFYEEEGFIYFHKPVGAFLYYTKVDIKQFPDEEEIKNLKNDFNDVEIPEKLIKPFTIKVIADDSWEDEV